MPFAKSCHHPNGLPSILLYFFIPSAFPIFNPSFCFLYLQFVVSSICPPLTSSFPNGLPSILLYFFITSAFSFFNPSFCFLCLQFVVSPICPPLISSFPSSSLYFSSFLRSVSSFLSSRHLFYSPFFLQLLFPSLHFSFLPSVHHSSPRLPSSISFFSPSLLSNYTICPVFLLF